MNWIFLALSFAVLPISQANPEPSAASTAGIVTWITETDHDFGELRSGSTARFVFKFQNTQSTPIVLQTVRTTCGCTAAQWPEAPIGPGETGDVAIEFDATHSGSFKKKITVFFDKQRKAETLWVRGEVE